MIPSFSYLCKYEKVGSRRVREVKIGAVRGALRALAFGAAVARPKSGTCAAAGLEAPRSLLRLKLFAAPACLPPHRAIPSTRWTVSATASMSRSDSGGSSPERVRKKRKRQEQHQIEMACRDGDMEAAVAAFQSAEKDGAVLPAYTYSSVLFLCAGGGQVAPHELPTAMTEAPGVHGKEHQAAARAVISRMEESGLVKNENFYTSLVRLAILRGDVAEAQSIVGSMEEGGVVLRLRTLSPIVHGLSSMGKLDEAMALSTRMQGELDMQFTEDDLVALMRACAIAGSAAQAKTVLHWMRETLTEVSATGVQSVAADLGKLNLVDGEAAGFVGIGPLGVCKEHKDIALRVVELKPEEIGELRKSIYRIGTQRATGGAKEFQKFIDWLADNGPYEWFIDGANVAMFGQSKQMTFSFRQLKEIFDAAKAQTDAAGCKRGPLILLHEGRIRGKEANRNRELIDEWIAGKNLYVTPVGSNDDWYWLYATSIAGNDSRLVSNDELRDHTFQMLGERYLGRWKERHRVTFSFNLNWDRTEAVLKEFKLPPPFTRCIQWVDGHNGTLMFPVIGQKSWFMIPGKAGKK